MHVSAGIDLMGKRVLVVGQADDLSQTVATGFRGRGAHVATLASFDPPSSPDVASIQSRVMKSIQELGGLDTLIACISPGGTTAISEATEKSWESAFTSPSKAAFFATQAALGALKISRGSIVNVTSVLALMGAPPGLAITAAAMACFVHHTRMMALRLSTDGVRVNAICYGYQSPLEAYGRTPPEDASLLSPGGVIPLGRWSNPADIIGTALFLASPLAAHMTGSIVVNDGGTYGGH